MTYIYKKMRIGFDVRPFLKEETGVGVYFRNLLFELAEIDAEDEFFLFSASLKDRFPKAKIPPFKKLRFVDKHWPVRVVNAAWDRFGRPSIDTVFRTRMDLTHSPTPLRLPASGKSVVTVCDLFFMEEPEKADREARDRFLRQTEDSLKAADGVVTISEFSARAIRDRFGLAAEKVKVTYLGLSPIFSEPSSPAEIAGIRRKLDLPGEFLLFVGALEKRKNLPALIEALALVHQKRNRLPLVLAGRPGGDQDAVRRAIDKRGLRSWVRQAGYLTDLEIRSLYHAASALVFPSLAEGFGLPLLEAMACGLPSAVSGVSALPEIGGDAALYFKPEDPKNMAAAIVRVLDDQSLRVALFQRGPVRAREFSWRRTAKTTLDFYRSTAGRS